MGGSRWSDDHYRDRVAERVATHTPTFAHDVAVRTGKTTTAIHPTMDPKLIKNNVRESRDSDAHPNSKPVLVFLDVTGSMQGVPNKLQTVLPKLMGLLVRKNYIIDPQVLMGAIGDYFGDRAPLQVGQFESGIEMDNDLTNMYLEGRGGGGVGSENQHESYQLAWFFASRMTICDSWDKRKQKGYLITIGDENPYGSVTREEIQAVFGIPIEEDRISTEQLIKEAQEKWELFHIIPSGTYHGRESGLQEAWEKRLGVEHVIRIDDVDNTCEIIGSTIGLMEGNVDQETVIADLKDVGTSEAVAQKVSKALDGVARTALARRATGTIAGGGTDDKTERL